MTPHACVLLYERRAHKSRPLPGALPVSSATYQRVASVWLCPSLVLTRSTTWASWQPLVAGMLSGMTMLRLLSSRYTRTVSSDSWLDPAMSLSRR